MTGYVKSMVSDRGYGFISCEGRDYFFHVKRTDRALPFNDSIVQRQVEFEIEECGDGRAQAVNVRPVGMV